MAYRCPASALGHIEQTIALYEIDKHKALAWRYGHDIKVAAHMNHSVTLWLLGFPERAAASLREGLEHARAIDHAESLAFILVHVGVILHLVARDPAGGRKCAEELLALAEEFGVPVWAHMARIQLGRSLFEEGSRAEGFAMMQESFGSPEEPKMHNLLPGHAAPHKPYIFLTLLNRINGKIYAIKAGVYSNVNTSKKR